MVSMLTPVSRDNSPIGIPSNLAREAVTGGMLKAPCFCSRYRMHLRDMMIKEDDLEARVRRGRPGRRRHAWRARLLVVLHAAARALLPRCQRSMDRELHAACALSALFHRSNSHVPGMRLLAGLPIGNAYLRRGRGLRAASVTSHGQGNPHPGNHPRRRRAWPRLHRFLLSHLVTGEPT